MTMTHPGLPFLWGMSIAAIILFTTIWALLAPSPRKAGTGVWSLARLPVIGPWLRQLVSSPWVLLLLKLVMVAFFLLVIFAGLYGTPIPERNIATMLTWNLWWTGLIISVLFLGTAWCAVCPWDSLAQWLVRHRLWRRASPNNSLNLQVPRLLKNIWPALLLFIGLTWMELGVGITTNPYATALVALLMVVLATISLALFDRKAFCRYFCPVGRTIGFYSQLAPIELRPIDSQVCANCKTLDCYHGSKQIEPCPTWLVMGRLTQNSYCTSCGNCSQSCPQQNIAWRLRSPSVEAIQDGRPHWDEAWFMVVLLALTAFHGLTMMPFWEDWISTLARTVGDSGQLLWSFSLGLIASLGIVVAVYTLVVAWTRHLTKPTEPFNRVFSTLAFTALPLAFAYHIAHNLNHLVREGAGLGSVFRNPLGTGTAPYSMLEQHARHMDLLINQDVLFALQALLMTLGFLVAVQVVRYRGSQLLAMQQRSNGWRLAPMFLFAAGFTGFHLWLLMQPMVVRM